MSLNCKKVISWEKFLYPEESDEEEEEVWSESNENIVGMKTFVPRHAKFNLWIGHTNFPLTLSMLPKFSEIANLTAVEAIKIVSKLRFVVGVGKNPTFDFEKVKLDITRILCSDD